MQYVMSVCGRANQQAAACVAGRCGGNPVFFSNRARPFTHEQTSFDQNGPRDNHRTRDTSPAFESTAPRAHRRINIENENIGNIEHMV